nr:squamosa promoter-binding-like protein 9 isoform X2 [Physcomitrium patens]|eukprot:XP_024372071.1 squamosa promoter-binding-like protein 9 isoform X2 [Physcomitrella patens]
MGVWGLTFSQGPQSSKFHVLSDFDEGKRSCRFKLERHNNRRRRKVQESGEDGATPGGGSDKASLNSGGGRVNGDENSAVESKAHAEVEQSVVVQVSKEASSPVEQSDTTDTTQILSAGIVDGSGSRTDGAQEALSAPRSKEYTMPGPNVSGIAESAPLWNSTETPGGVSNGHKSGVDEDSLLALLLEDSPNVDERLPSRGFESTSPIPPRSSKKPSAYASSHPTARISFKLYDWNPGDFPRNLRQQILEWLSNMPVDLEGYIRSGCTILTLFISMPQSMWEGLNADWEGAVARLVCNPQNTSGFWEKGYFKAKLGRQTVHFENGKAVNRSGGKEDCMPCMPVLQSVEPVCFRAGTGCMLSITGRNLLQANTKLLMSHGGKYIKAWVLKASSEGKQEDKWQIVVPPVDECQAGPVFIEVENEDRLSNIMVVLVGDAEFCNEVESMELYTSSCEAQDLLFDLGWMLKESTLDSGVLIQRLRSLLDYANAKGWERVAERILEAADRRGVLRKLVGAADARSFDWRNIWAESTGHSHSTYKLSSFAVPVSSRSYSMPSLAQSKRDADEHTHIVVCNSSSKDLTTTSLLPQRGMREKRRSPWGRNTYRLVFAVASATAACAGLCVVLQHPEQVAQLSTSLRRCLWSN